MCKYFVKFVDGEIDTFGGHCEGYDVRSTVANFYDEDRQLIATIPVDRIKAIYRDVTY